MQFARHSLLTALAENMKTAVVSHVGNAFPPLPLRRGFRRRPFERTDKWCVRIGESVIEVLNNAPGGVGIHDSVLKVLMVEERCNLFGRVTFPS